MGEVLVPYGDTPSETATLLLGAADELGHEPYVVRNQPDDGGFRVPEEVAKKAKMGKQAISEEEQAKAAEQQVRDDAAAAEKAQAEQAAADSGEQMGVGQQEPKAPAKRTPAKRTAKKTAAKKTASK